MYDTHVHSRFSPDGTSDVSEYIKLIDEGKIKKMGFAEHRDFMPQCGGYGFMRYDDYYSCIKVYREKGYEVFAGAEIDYAKAVENEILEALKVENYDYTICSVHMVGEIAVSDKRSAELFMNTDSLMEILDSYYSEIHSSIKVGRFDVLGHIGIYKRYISEDFFNRKGLKKQIVDIEDEIARECALSEKIVEVNASGLFAPFRSTIADSDFLKRYYIYGGRRISIGSDAHNAARLSAGIVQAEDILKVLGFRYIYFPWDKENPAKL